MRGVVLENVDDEVDWKMKMRVEKGCKQGQEGGKTCRNKNVKKEQGNKRHENSEK